MPTSTHFSMGETGSARKYKCRTQTSEMLKFQTQPFKKHTEDEDWVSLAIC